jgi:hypothetical protein
MNEVS